MVGARPQFIKTYPVSKALEAIGGVKEIMIHTGQHYDENMSAIFFEQMGLREPEYNLGIGSGQHGYQTGRMLEGIEKALVEEKPDLVLLYGDTNSTLAGALAAAKLYIPSAHIEAGLRSFNRKMPEEINRIVVDHLVDLCFAPSTNAVYNLRNEGIHKNVYLVGDVMFDATSQFAKIAKKRSQILRKLDLKPQEFLLVTIHRAENTDNRKHLSAILETLYSISKQMKVVFPVHPRTRKQMEKLRDAKTENSQVLFIDPVGYLDMIELERNSRIIVTDSGGVQKEAYFHQVPCVTLRDETEWVELVDVGANRLASPIKVNAMQETILEMCEVDFENIPKDIYGSGEASKQIASVLLKYEK